MIYNGIDFSDEMLSEMWKTFDWKSAENKLFSLQQALTKVSFRHDSEKIRKIQNSIVTSLEAKALAVRKVSEILDSSPGIDGIRWTKDAEKMRAAISLSRYNYKAKPFKRIVIRDKRNLKERRIGIPCMYDRAMQILYSFALDPIAEATADRKSFAFRKGRSTFDAHSLIMDALKQENAPQWVLVCDVKSCYDSISHNWLLNNIPMDKNVLRQFLQSGFVFNNEIFPTDCGISLGCNLSPLLGNMVLDGLQKLLYDLQDSNNIDYYNGYVVRFADDIFVTARSELSARKFKSVIENFLSERGLIISEGKTQLVNITKGFTYLSRFYCKIDGHIHCIPSEKAVLIFEDELQDLILNPETKWSQRNLISTLNSKLYGWASYHRIEESMDTFKHLDVIVSALLLKLMTRMYPNKNTKFLIDKYWYKESDGRMVYSLVSDRQVKIINLADVSLIKHKKINLKENIYLDSGYFKKRNDEQEIAKMSGKYKSVWERQNGLCYYCGKKINPMQSRRLVQKNLSKDISIKNKAYVHDFCVNDEMIFINSDIVNIRNIDVYEIVKDLESSPPKNKRKSIYASLTDYFYSTSKSPITLSFSDIEKILGFKLCNSAYKYTCYWYRKGAGLFPNSWTSQGYHIVKLDLKNQKIIFRKNTQKSSKLNIPAVFMTSKISDSAKYELEHFFQYIIKKYGF